MIQCSRVERVRNTRQQYVYVKNFRLDRGRRNVFIYTLNKKIKILSLLFYLHVHVLLNLELQLYTENRIRWLFFFCFAVRPLSVSRCAEINQSAAAVPWDRNNSFGSKINITICFGAYTITTRVVYNRVSILSMRVLYIYIYTYYTHNPDRHTAGAFTR